MIFDNTDLKTRLKVELLELSKNQNNKAALYIIQIGDDFASQKYAQMKQKISEKLELECNYYQFTSFATESDKRRIENFILNQIPEGSGLIFQLPFPLECREWGESLMYQAFKPKQNKKNFIDVDFLASPFDSLSQTLPPTIAAIDLVLKQALFSGYSSKPLNTPTSIISLLQQKLSLAGKTVAIIGQGKLVGSFMLQYLKDRQATIISVNEFTKQSELFTRQADIVVSATGKNSLVNSNWLKEGTIIIDAGTSEAREGGLAGDVDMAELQEKGRLEDLFICPSPKGIGPITVLCLFYNLLKM